MPALLDTGFFYAILDRSDAHHEAVKQTLSSINETIILPVPVITEVAYLVQKYLGTTAMADFVDSLASIDLVLLGPEREDYRRAAEIVRQYHDARIDFVDAVLVAVAERLDIERILTIDRRHFHLIRPRHCATFTVLP